MSCFGGGRHSFEYCNTCGSNREEDDSAEQNEEIASERSRILSIIKDVVDEHTYDLIEKMVSP